MMDTRMSHILQMEIFLEVVNGSVFIDQQKWLYNGYNYGKPSKIGQRYGSRT